MRTTQATLATIAIIMGMALAILEHREKKAGRK